jgi:hypothetical protein
MLRLFKQGVPLDFDHSMPNSPSTQQSTAITLTPDHLPVHSQSSQSWAPPGTDNISFAMHLRHEFDEEDRALSAQRTEFVESARGSFECGVCMEETLVDSIAIIDACGHSFCRECLLRHVTARLDEHRFPVLCPTCTAGEGKGKGKTSGTCICLQIGARSDDFCRGFAVSSSNPRTHRDAIQHMVRNGDGRILCPRTLSKVRLPYSFP